MDTVYILPQLGILSFDADKVAFLYYKRYIAPLYGRFVTDSGTQCFHPQLHSVPDKLEYTCVDSSITDHPEESHVSYMDNGDQLTVTWNNVRLRHSNDTARYSFAITLFPTGEIRFDYTKISPQASLAEFKGDMVIGISDAVEEESDQIPAPFDFPVRGSHFSQYHKIDLSEKKGLVTNGTSIAFVPRSNCNQMHDCAGCVGFSER